MNLTGHTNIAEANERGVLSELNLRSVQHQPLFKLGDRHVVVELLAMTIVDGRNLTKCGALLFTLGKRLVLLPSRIWIYFDDTLFSAMEPIPAARPCRPDRATPKITLSWAIRITHFYSNSKNLLRRHSQAPLRLLRRYNQVTLVSLRCHSQVPLRLLRRHISSNENVPQEISQHNKSNGV